MTILTWPADLLEPASIKLALAANTQSGGKSPFDGTEQTLELPGARWTAELVFEGLFEDEARPLHAFLARLGGRAGRFLWSPPLRRRAAAAGSPRVQYAGATGNVLSTIGWTSGTGWATEPGDFVGFIGPTGRAQLHMALERSYVTPEGVAAFAIAPPLRRSPAVDTPVVFTLPAAVWKLTDDDTALLFERGLAVGEATINIEEAIW